MPTVQTISKYIVNRSKWHLSQLLRSLVDKNKAIVLDEHTNELLQANIKSIARAGINVSICWIIFIPVILTIVRYFFFSN